MQFNRRRFLNITSMAATVALLGTATRVVSHSRHAYVKAVVRERLHYLKLDEEVLNEFAKNFLTLTLSMDTIRGRIVSFGGVTLSRMLLRISGADIAFKLDLFEQMIASDFLKATDFFDEGANVERELQYISFPDPYVNPCRNALTHLS